MFKKIFPGLLLIFVNMFSFSLLIPILPDIVNEALGESSGLVFGLILSIYSLMQFFATPFLGALSDCYGRRPILILSQAGTTLSWLIFGMAYFFQGQVWWGIPLVLVVLSFARVVDGITGGNNSVAQAWISDLSSGENRTQAFGYSGAAHGLALATGPLVGGLTYQTSYGMLATAGFSFALSVFTLVMIIWKLPETLEGEDRDAEFSVSFAKFNIFKQLALLNLNSEVSFIVFSRVCFALVFVSFTTSIALLFRETFGLEPGMIGVIMTMIGMFSVFNQSVVVRRFADFFQIKNAYFFAMFILMASFMCLSWIVNFSGGEFWGVTFVLLLPIFYFNNLSASSVMTLFRTIITNEAEKSKQGLATGIDESISALGRGLVPPLAGQFFDEVGFWVFFWYGVFLLIPVAGGLYVRRLSVK